MLLVPGAALGLGLGLGDGTGSGADAALDLDSMLDGATNTSEEEEDMSAAADDTRAIRRQLEGLEGMYSEVGTVHS